MVKILITGANFHGKGAASMLVSTSQMLKSLMPDAEIVVSSKNLEFDSTRGRKYGLRFFDSNLRHGIIFFSALLRMLRELAKADLVVDLSGFSFTDHFRMFGLFGPPSFDILLSKLLGRRVAMYSQAMGPFKSRWVRLSARLFLQRANLIVVRGEITKDYLREIGIEKQVYVHADSAFLLQPASAERVDEIMFNESFSKEEDALLVGISVNARIYERCDPLGSENTYVALMAQITDYLAEKTGAKVVFIPYEISTRGYDDKSIAREIYEIVENKRSIKLIENEYSAEEAKALIGNLDLFIGCRFHSVVASTSVLVPTIAIAWSHKYYETMKMLGQEKYVCHFREISLSHLTRLIEDMLKNREQIKKDLKARVKKAKHSALESAKLIKNLLCPQD